MTATVAMALHALSRRLRILALRLRCHARGWEYSARQLTRFPMP
jgi:hypothetical protein